MTKHSLPYMNDKVAKRASESIPPQDLLTKATFLLTQKKLFLCKELKMEQVCNTLEVKPYSLSKVLKKHSFSNFSHFVNHFRVEEAKRMMAVPEFDMYTLEAIAEMAGFGTRQAFYNSFEKQAGMSPASYRRMLKRQHSGQERGCTSFNELPCISYSVG